MKNPCTVSLISSAAGFAFSVPALSSPRCCCWGTTRVLGRKRTWSGDGGKYHNLLLSLLVLYSQFWCLPISEKALASKSLPVFYHITNLLVQISPLGQMISWGGDDWHQGALSRHTQRSQCTKRGWGVGGQGAEQSKRGLNCSRGVREVLGANELLTRLIGNTWK